MGYMESYNIWLNDTYFDEETKKELMSIKDNEKEIEDRFFKELEFGTGGLRGVIGAGTNRMNIYSVRKATQGLANYILLQDGKEGSVKDMGVVIAYDSRNMSPEFALTAALVLNGNGIKTYLFDELRPTPELSFAVRHLGAIAGIVITASHNPPEYNGYKAYWSDGGQIPYPKDEEIIAQVQKVSEYGQIKTADKTEAEQTGLFNIIGKEIDDEYVKNVKAQSLNPDIIKKVADELTIVYTPLHGTGNKPVRRILKEIGFNNVHVVGEQELPDAKFSTVDYPNPEDPKAFKLAMKLADTLNADIVIGTDPDADRVGAVVKDKDGEYVILSGNMTGALITEYILSQKKQAGTLPKNGAIISTIVSTNMTEKIAESYGVDFIQVLTGFKYIGEKIKEFEKTESKQFLFGFEESYGCLAGTYARDKDAVLATMLICEIAAFYKARGMNMLDGLTELYEKYGYFKESIQSISLKGIEGLENIKKIMNSLRQSNDYVINGCKVIEARDYKSGITLDVKTGQTNKITLPKSDVLYYVLEDGSWVCVRPSGTEPKIKVYFGVCADSKEKAEQKMEGVMADMMALVNNSY